MCKIPGGYYLMARQEKYSDIAHAPPHTREIWRYLIREANHYGRKRYGYVLERGQVLTTYEDIMEGLHWMVGWRKKRYSKDQCETAMKFLRQPRGNGPMITTRKTTRGIIITICNYDFFQNPKNYDNHTDDRYDSQMETCNVPQTRHTIDKNVKNENINNIVETDVPTQSKNGCPYEQIKDLYHQILPELPLVRKLTSKRKSYLKSRWFSGLKLKDGTCSNSIEFWDRFFNFIRESDFLMGKRDPPPGRARFSADFEWLIKESNFIKILESKYHR